MKKVFIGFFLCIFLSFQLSAQETFIHCGQLIDGINRQPISKMTVVVKDNRILSVEKRFEPPSNGANLIDLNDKTVISGFIDLHVHIHPE